VTKYPKKSNAEHRKNLNLIKKNASNNFLMKGARSFSGQAKKPLLMMGMMGGAVGGVILITGANSFGGNIGVVSMAFNSIYYVSDLIKSGYN
jgi:hypothetical protein